MATVEGEEAFVLTSEALTNLREHIKHAEVVEALAADFFFYFTLFFLVVNFGFIFIQHSFRMHCKRLLKELGSAGGSSCEGETLLKDAIWYSAIASFCNVYYLLSCLVRVSEYGLEASAPRTASVELIVFICSLFAYGWQLCRVEGFEQGVRFAGRTYREEGEEVDELAWTCFGDCSTFKNDCHCLFVNGYNEIPVLAYSDEPEKYADVKV